MGFFSRVCFCIYRYLLSGYCGFESSLCGLKHDQDAAFTWVTGSGKTPSEMTGPLHDHTTLSAEGKFVITYLG